jgi:Fanconi anemia group M protein
MFTALRDLLLHPDAFFKQIAKEDPEYTVSAFPEIGMKNARILLSHFGSIQSIANAGLAELTAIKGIGEKTAQKIYDLCRRRYT